MKSSFIHISIILFVAIVIGTSCTEKPEEILIWNDPPTTADTLYQNPVFSPKRPTPLWSCCRMVRFTPMAPEKETGAQAYIGQFPSEIERFG
jgi:hypothetical protein